MSSFGQYVAGKSIAIVGPAPMVGDQSAQIDAHDIVYRTSYGFGWRQGMEASPQGDCWTRGLFPAGTGTRVDMAFYNGMATRQQQHDNALDDVYRDLDWAVHKLRPTFETVITKIRHCNHPTIGGRRIQGNQVTLMVFDLSFFQPETVTVFGADFYAGTTDTWYDPGYMQPGWDRAYDDPTDVFHPGAAFEDQEDQRIIIRGVRDAYGWPAGDDRFLAALYLSPEQHQAAMLAESARHREMRASV